MKTLVFLGSKPVGAACLDILLAQATTLGCRVIAVLTTARPEFSEQRTVQLIAEEHGIPVLEGPHQIPDCDFICSVQYHKILLPDQIKKARKLAFNLHLAPLPEYRGCNQFSFAIYNEAQSFGVSIHRIDERIDHGDLLFEKRFPLDANIWVESLYLQSVDAAIQLFERSLPSIICDTDKLTKIDTTGRASAIYYRHQIHDLKCISPTASMAELQKIIRATAMPGFEPPYFLIGEEKVYCIPQRHRQP